MNRYSRQENIVPAEKLFSASGNDIVTVIGVGAIGRNVAIQLAAMGAQKIQIIDFDFVEEHNIASQGFMENDIGLPKVEAVKRTCEAINSDIEVLAVDDRFKKSIYTGGVVFSCVDSMSVREFVWNSVKNNVELFIDGRMSAEVCRILSVPCKSEKEKDFYKSTLFSDEEAHVGSCTAKSTIYCSNIAAGLMVSSFTKWLRSIPTDKDIFLNILMNEISYGEDK